MKRTLISLAFMTMVIPSFNNVSAQGLLEPTTVEHCIPNHQEAVLVVDVSGSMMLNPPGMSTNKYAMTLEFFSRLARVADKRVYARLWTSSPFTEQYPKSYSDNKKQASVQTSKTWTDLQEVLSGLPDRLEVFGRPTWMSSRMLELLQEDTPSRTLVWVTDGRFSENPPSKVAPSVVIERFLKGHPTNKLWVVSAAYTDEEQQAIKKLFGEDVFELQSLLTDQKGFERFISQVFSEKCIENPLFTFESAFFDFDKATLRPEGKEAIKRAADTVRKIQKSSTKTISKIHIMGWTDWMGSDAYNRLLSQKRAETVRTAIIQEGIDPALLSAEGRGISFKFSNDTQEGRQNNRRVELIVEY